VLGLAACGGGDDDEDGGSGAAWQGPERPPSGTVPVDEFEAETADALETARTFLALDGTEAARTVLDVRAGPEGQGPVRLTATLLGLADDSVAALRYDVRLEKDDEGVWRVRSATWAQRCVVGRGHGDFSPERCI
jgi:hypothetical protein